MSRSASIAALFKGVGIKRGCGCGWENTDVARITRG